MSMVAVYNDDPAEVDEAALTSYACISKPEGFAGHDAFEEMTVGGGRYLVGTFVGHYSGLGEAWQEAMAKAATYGHREGDHFEKYLVHDEQSPERSVTEIYVPIADA